MYTCNPKPTPITQTHARPIRQKSKRQSTHQTVSLAMQSCRRVGTCTISPSTMQCVSPSVCLPCNPSHSLSSQSNKKRNICRRGRSAHLELAFCCRFKNLFIQPELGYLAITCTSSQGIAEKHKTDYSGKTRLPMRYLGHYKLTKADGFYH